jgi:hypothetical protein
MCLPSLCYIHSTESHVGWRVQSSNCPRDARVDGWQHYRPRWQTLTSAFWVGWTQTDNYVVVKLCYCTKTPTTDYKKYNLSINIFTPTVWTETQYFYYLSMSINCLSRKK